MSLNNDLEKIGLTEKQAKVYLACLELGGGNVTNIAKKAKIQRTTCYPVLNELLNLGLVSKSKQKKRGYFLAEDPKNLEQTAKTKLQTIQEILPQLQAIHNILPQKTPKVSLYEGWEGVRLIYEDSLKCSHSGDTILSYSNFEELNKYLSKPWSVDYYSIQRKERKIRVRLIAVDGPVAKKMQKEDTRYLRETRIAPKGAWNFGCDMKIYANKVAIVSFKENFMSVLIESKEIAEMMKMAFELMWKGANI